MDTMDVARHWANRITVEFGEYNDLRTYAQLLNEGKVEQVYEANKHLLSQSITKVPGKPIKLYFLKEMVSDLKQYCER